MGKIYRQLSLDERSLLACLHTSGQSIRQIAASLDRAASTISRELKRNRSHQAGYRPAYADGKPGPAAGAEAGWSASRNCNKPC